MKQNNITAYYVLLQLEAIVNTRCVWVRVKDGSIMIVVHYN